MKTMTSEIKGIVSRLRELADKNETEFNQLKAKPELNGSASAALGKSGAYRIAALGVEEAIFPMAARYDAQQEALAGMIIPEVLDKVTTLSAMMPVAQRLEREAM